MSKYLCKSVNQYRVDTMEQCEQYLSEMKQNPMYEIIKSVVTKKETKDDEFYILEVTKRFNDPKYASDVVDVIYERV